MSNHARMLSENLQGRASVIQYGEGVIVALDQGDVFGKDQFVLKDNAKEILRYLAFNLNQMPDTYILVAGRADSDGKSEHNDKLAYKRAAAAANYLHGCGIEEDRFFVDSYGESYPDFKNNTGINKNKNRRVDFLILPSNALREDMAMN
jgi:outer membrane protein OmpA-like peptidoglycan-associated protein